VRGGYVAVPPRIRQLHRQPPRPPFGSPRIRKADPNRSPDFRQCRRSGARCVAPPANPEPISLLRA
jgi:hypothetical protein